MSQYNRIIFLMIFLFLLSCNQSESAAEKERKNLKTCLSFVDNVWNNKDLTSLESFFADTFSRNVNSIEAASNLHEMTAIFNIYFIAFPDLHFTVEQITPIDDQLFMTWNMTGTNTGVFGDNPATGKQVQINGITRLDFNDDNKIVKQNVFYTELSLLQQLGHTLQRPE
ncbi:ester cyclase [Lutimonas sp.]|uniref:ester cyclase n=1 Tax=Lutimonas sp. TaxID=1872403 RepID=UPI003D9B18B2